MPAVCRQALTAPTARKELRTRRLASLAATLHPCTHHHVASAQLGATVREQLACPVQQNVCGTLSFTGSCVCVCLFAPAGNTTGLTTSLCSAACPPGTYSSSVGTVNCPLCLPGYYGVYCLTPLCVCGTHFPSPSDSCMHFVVEYLWVCCFSWGFNFRCRPNLWTHNSHLHRNMSHGHVLHGRLCCLSIMPYVRTLQLQLPPSPSFEQKE